MKLDPDWAPLVVVVVVFVVPGILVGWPPWAVLVCAMGIVHGVRQERRRRRALRAAE